MQARPMPRADLTVSEIGLGCWQLGADWGEVSDADARAVLHAALDSGVHMLDTADVYGDGRSERLVGAVVAERGDLDRVTIATKAGRRADPHVADAYHAQALRGWVERSLANLGVDRLDLLQLHCPPTAVYDDDAVFDALDALVDEGLLHAYGVSVETCDEALAAIARPNVASVQIILNAFRRKPLEQVLPAAQAAGVAIIARVPLASGLLTGRYRHDTTFSDDDHRTYNRDGEAFDVGETFAGVPFDVGVEAAREVSALADDRTPAQLALRWILDQPAVTTVIPGARNVEQVTGNVAVSDQAPLTADTHQRLSDIYDASIRPHVHHRW
ncbi:MAG: aldo/keto reductase [Nitriliruptoraceae bacterium]|nr:aldo/keto reductase [Nitriliruptoraceae bacterium]